MLLKPVLFGMSERKSPVEFRLLRYSSDDEQGTLVRNVGLVFAGLYGVTSQKTKLCKLCVGVMSGERRQSGAVQYYAHRNNSLALGKLQGPVTLL
jgi:hypothetical protein